MAIIKEGFEELKTGGTKIEREVRERTVGYIMAAFGLVAGLAWNDAIKALIDHFFPAGGNSLLLKFMYALVVTLVVVIITMNLVRFGRAEDSK